MKPVNTPYSFPIDLVYLWVDGNDPEWRAKRNQYMNIGGDFATQGRVEARWIESDELRYSLRSVEMYAPWINRIFIVTDNQCPSWINLENSRVRVVDHSEILPAEALPTFNSIAIESCIYKIPELAEHFILGNDDTIFSAPTRPDTFFKADGAPIIRLNGAKFKRAKADKKGHYSRTVKHMQDLILNRYGKAIFHAPHHNFDAYRKSDWESCVNMMPKAWSETAHHRFRHDNDILRCFVDYHVIASGVGEMRKVGRYNRINGVMGHIAAMLSGHYGSDSRCIPLVCKDYDAVLAKYNPMMICMNDGEGTSDDDRQRMVEFLKRKYPTKSSFEK